MKPKKDNIKKELEKELEALEKRQLTHIKNRYSLNKAEIHLYEKFLHKKIKLKEATKEELFLFVQKLEEDDVDIEKMHKVIDEQYPSEDKYSEEDDIKNAYKSHRKHLDDIKQEYALNENELTIYDKYIYAWIEKGNVSVEQICHMLREFDTGSIDLEKMDKLINKEFNKKIEDELTWDETTQGDMLTLALRELDEGLGIVSSQSCGYSKEKAWNYMKMLLEDYSAPMGYIYSTDQEIRRCLINMEMSFNFGSVQGDEKESIEIGKKITEVFDEYDIDYDWDGTATSTIDVFDHYWQSRSDFSPYDNESKKAKKAFEKLVDIVVVNTKEKEKVLEFEDKSDIDDMLTSMLAFVDENDLSFTIWMDWKEEVESLKYLVERFLNKNYKELKISLPNIDNNQVVSDDGVFAVFDEALRKSGLQFGFIDGESDAYIAIIHQTNDKNAVKNLVNKMGYEYMEEDEACEGSAKDQVKGILVDSVKDITGEVLEFEEPLWFYKFTMQDLHNIYDVMDECFGNCKIIVNDEEVESLGDIKEFDVASFKLKSECKHRFATFVIQEKETKLLSTMDDSFEKGDVTDILITKVHEALKDTEQNANFFATYKFFILVNMIILGYMYYVGKFVSGIIAVSNIIFYGIFKKFRKNRFDFREDEEEFEEGKEEQARIKKESIPHFLKKFEKELEPYKKECVKITATPKGENPLKDEMPLTKSKFFGLPFYPKNKEYPKDAKGLPMVLAAQINFEEVPHLEDFPKDGILQLFLSGINWYQEDENYKIVYHSKSELKLENIEDFSFIDFEKYDDIPIDEVHELAFKKAIENGSTNDFRFDFLFDGMELYEFENTLSEEDRDTFYDYFDADGHKIGGYSQFTQDPEYVEVQLLQIDSDQQIMFGDAGIAHIFIGKEDLKNKRFDKAYFYWDCT